MYKKFISLSLILFLVCNILFCSLRFFVEYLKLYSSSYNTSSAVVLNFSKSKNIAKGFVDVCSNIGNMLTECNKNDKTKPVISQKENTNKTFPIIYIDKIINNNSAGQYKYNFCDIGFFTITSYVKKHIVDKPDRTSNIFLLLLLQILIYLIVLNMCKYFNNFCLDINRITLSF